MAMFFYGFMQRALITAVLMAVLAPLLGLFLILRRQSLMADTLSHVSLAGVALGLFVNLNPTVTTLVVVILATILIEYITRAYQTYAEVAIAIIMAAGLAVALTLMSLDRGTSAMSVDQYLFGSIVAISNQQVLLLVVLMVIVVGAYVLFHRPMYVLTFSPATARAEGLPVQFMSLVFNALTGVTIAVIMPIAGALLVSAVMILPAAIAMRVARRFNTVVLAGIGIGMVGTVGGLVCSYDFNTPPGAAITLLLVAIFLLCLGGRGIWRRLRGRRLMFPDKNCDS